MVKQELCTTSVFRVMQKLGEIEDKGLVTSFRERMTLLESGMGHINYAYLEPEYYPLDTHKQLRLLLVTIKQEFIDIKL